MKNNYRFQIKIRPLSYPAQLLFLWLMELYFMTGARFVLHRLGMSGGLLGNLVLIGVASIPLAVLLLDLKHLRQSRYFSGFILIAAVWLIFGITALFHPDYSHFFTKPNYGIERVLRPECAIYAFLFFGLVDDPDDLMEVLRRYAVLDYIYILILQLGPRILTGYFEDVNYAGETVQRTYSLSFGYAMLLPVVILLYLYLRERKLWCLVGSLAGVLFIFLYGNRGALLMVAIFIGLMVIDHIVESQGPYRIYRLAAVALIVLFLILFGRLLIEGAVRLLQSMGIESRTLELLASGEITDDSGRDKIWNASIQGICNGGLFGYGAFGDRQFVEPVHYAGYSHNIILELIASFGILGIAAIIKIAIDSFRMIFLCKDRRWRGLFIIFFSISCQLMLSMSVWYVMEFWAAAAIAHKYFSLMRSSSQTCSASIKAKMTVHLRSGQNLYTKDVRNQTWKK